MTSAPKTGPLRVAMIANDERDQLGQTEVPLPFFGPAPATLIDGFRDMEGVELHLVSCERKPVVPSPQLAGNIFFHAVQIPRWAYLRTLYLGSTLRIRKTLGRIRPDLVHSQGTERFCGIAGAFSGYPNVLTIHGNMRAVARALKAGTFSFHGITAMLETVAVKRATGVICLSDYTRAQVADIARRTWTLPNAVSEEFFAVPRQPDAVPRLFCAGTVCPYKNQSALIQSLDVLALTHRFTLAFAGPLDGTAYSREFEQVVAQRPWCEYLGKLDPAAMRAQLSRATLLVHPSLEDNCPMVILEAMAASLPVVASTCGGIPGLVEEGSTGFLFAPHQLDLLQARVKALIEQPVLAGDMGTAAHRRARERFLPSTVAAQHMAIYREALCPRKNAV